MKRFQQRTSPCQSHSSTPCSYSATGVVWFARTGRMYHHPAPWFHRVVFQFSTCSTFPWSPNQSRTNHWHSIAQLDSPKAIWTTFSSHSRTLSSLNHIIVAFVTDTRRHIDTLLLLQLSAVLKARVERYLCSLYFLIEEINDSIFCRFLYQPPVMRSICLYSIHISMIVIYFYAATIITHICCEKYASSAATIHNKVFSLSHISIVNDFCNLKQTIITDSRRNVWYTLNLWVIVAFLFTYSANHFHRHRVVDSCMRHCVFVVHRTIRTFHIFFLLMCSK